MGFGSWLKGQVHKMGDFSFHNPLLNPMELFGDNPVLNPFGALEDALKGKNKVPQEDMSKYFNEIGKTEQKYYSPYIEHGQEAYKNFAPIVSQMASDPSMFLQNLQSKYGESPYFQMQKNNMYDVVNKATGGSGIKGDAAAYDKAAHLSDTLMNEGMQDWLRNTLGLQQQGLAGQQHLYDTGFNATANLTGDMANLYGTQAQYAFQNAQEKNKNWFDKLSGMFSGGAGLAGLISGGGSGGGTSTAPSQAPSRLHL